MTAHIGHSSPGPAIHRDARGAPASFAGVLTDFDEVTREPDEDEPVVVVVVTVFFVVTCFAVVTVVVVVTVFFGVLADFGFVATAAPFPG